MHVYGKILHLFQERYAVGKSNLIINNGLEKALYISFTYIYFKFVYMHACGVVPAGTRVELGAPAGPADPHT